MSQSRARRSGREDNTTRWVYDSLGRVVRTVAPDDATSRYEHTFFETRSWDPLSRQSKRVRDLDDRTVESVSHLGSR